MGGLSNLTGGPDKRGGAGHSPRIHRQAQKYSEIRMTDIDRTAEAYRAHIRALALHGRGFSCAMVGAAMPHNRPQST